MARPNINTPVPTVTAVLDAVAEWAATYNSSVARLYGPDYDAKARAEELSETLRARQQTYLREQREDVGHTNKRDESVQETQKLVSSGLSLGRIVFDEHDNADDVLRDFASQPPSRIRSPQAASAALMRLKTGFEIHREPMEQVFANVDEFDTKIDEVNANVDEVLANDVRENQETREAREQRDETRGEAVKFIRDLHMATEAVEIFQPKALRDLNIIFETHNPTRSSDSPEPARPASDDVNEPSDDVVEPVEDTPTPTDSPTPSGDDLDAPEPVEDDPVDSPTEA